MYLVAPSYRPFFIFSLSLSYLLILHFAIRNYFTTTILETGHHFCNPTSLSSSMTTSSESSDVLFEGSVVLHSRDHECKLWRDPQQRLVRLVRCQSNSSDVYSYSIQAFDSLNNEVSFHHHIRLIVFF